MEVTTSMFAVTGALLLVLSCAMLARSLFLWIQSTHKFDPTQLAHDPPMRVYPSNFGGHRRASRATAPAVHSHPD
jgi:hypothetical protein